jgi:RAB protein geranylgeranyltransferase component A
MQKADNYDASSNIHPCFYGYIPNNKLTLERAVHFGRRFLFDLTPKLVLCAGSMVNSLINSDVGRYLEFKAIENLYLIKSLKENEQTNILKVPCTKGEVFNSKFLSSIEKRILMKFLQFAYDWGELNSGEDLNTFNERNLSKGASLYRPQNKEHNKHGFDLEGFESKPFTEFLSHNKIPLVIQEVITYTLCMHSFDKNDDLKTFDALQSLYIFLTSLGKYGETAFLYPMYGSAEIIQSFCRMCAVWGGTYMLRQGVSKVIVNTSSNKALGIIDSCGKTFLCENLICNGSDFNFDLSSSHILCTRISLCSEDKAFFKTCSRGFGVIPPNSLKFKNLQPIHITQLDSTTHACPEGSCVLYISTILSKSDDTALIMEDLVHILKKCNSFDEIFYFILEKELNDDKKANNLNLPSNVFVTNCEKYSINFQNSLNQAKSIFSNLYPEEKFLFCKSTISEPISDEIEEISILNAALDSLHTFEDVAS